MRKISILFLLILFSTLTSGCDAGLKIVGIEIEKYPNKIVYFKGIDKELDLTGGVIKLIRKDKSVRAINMQDEEITILHSIDFNKPGIYVVELERHDTTINKFPIQVIELPKEKD